MVFDEHKTNKKLQISLFLLCTLPFLLSASEEAGMKKAAILDNEH